MLSVKINPDFLLNGANPRLIDEWQIAPELWDAVRFAVDHRDEDGQFIQGAEEVFGSCVKELLKNVKI